MQIEKRSMNWLPRPSLYDEAVAARAKRREHAQQALADQQNVAGTFSSLYTSNSQGQVDIAIRVAHSRLLAKPTRTDKTA